MMVEKQPMTEILLGGGEVRGLVNGDGCVRGGVISLVGNYSVYSAPSASLSTTMAR